MKTVAVLARKGGTGKTTLAVHLAVLASETGRPVLLVDTDPQRSATDWWNARALGPFGTRSPRLVTCAAKSIPQVLDAAEGADIDLVVVDTRPSVEADTSQVAQLADLVLIPTRPGILDLRAIRPTTEVVKAVRRPADKAILAAMIVLNGVPPARGLGENRLTTEARAALAKYGVPVATATIGNRAAFAHALIDGRSVTEFEPAGKAADELRHLFTIMGKILWPVAPAPR
jgi:chromosome partitioning protein